MSWLYGHKDKNNRTMEGNALLMRKHVYYSLAPLHVLDAGASRYVMSKLFHACHQEKDPPPGAPSPEMEDASELPQISQRGE